ncbi:MAG: Rab5-interacting protein-domain-containing protein [Monoraphidium minutum]|nr:MAG: Rab5-interacting protein-domain-containing protein [Monoraphidium minutum]
MRPQSAGGGRSTSASKPAAAAAAPSDPQDILYNPTNWKNNVGVVYYLRTYMTVVAGMAAGILGVTNLAGFVVYFISQMLCVPLILAKCGGSIDKYFPSWNSVIIEHVFSSTALLSYVLCWMIGYNLCYVF